MSSCEDCRFGYYCGEGAATPIPCPGGTYGNRTDLTTPDNCTKVVRDFWAPLGSPLPETCGSGFYCPGWFGDDENDVPGSKPLIMPVGGSTEVQEVEIVKQDLSLDMSCADFVYESVVNALAAQYGVDASLISFDNPCPASRRRGRKLALLTITIEIATPPPDPTGTAPTRSASDILASMASVSPATLASSIGTALGTAVNVTVTPPEKTTEERTVTVECEKGKWCTAGLIVECDEGTYNNATGQTSAVACTRCPVFSTTLGKASTSIDDCICDVDYYDAIIGPGVRCLTCPLGTACIGGATIDKLPLLPGKWRTALDSTQIEACSYELNCLAGTNLSNYCPEGNSGPLCAVCSDGYRRGTVGSCVACTGGVQSLDAADVIPMVFLGAVVLIASVACWQHRQRKRKRKLEASPAKKRAYRENPVELRQRIINGCLTKVKIMTAHQQVLQGLAGVFQVPFRAHANLPRPSQANAYAHACLLFSRTVPMYVRAMLQIKWPPAFKQFLSYFKVLPRVLTHSLVDARAPMPTPTDLHP